MWEVKEPLLWKSIGVGFPHSHRIDSITVTAFGIALAVNDGINHPIEQTNQLMYDIITMKWVLQDHCACQVINTIQNTLETASMKPCAILVQCVPKYDPNHQSDGQG